MTRKKSEWSDAAAAWAPVAACQNPHRGRAGERDRAPDGSRRDASDRETEMGQIVKEKCKKLINAKCKMQRVEKQHGIHAKNF